MTSPKPRMPVLFVGHGSPMNGTLDTAWSRGFRGLAGLVPRPRAILAVSAHWNTGGTYLTGQADPPTIHDFSGFPAGLFEVQYPAPGDPALAERVCSLLGRERASLRSDWGLDHGTWSVLKWMYPEADVPVVQLSIDRRLAPAEHHALALRLRPLREAGVLVFGSGNIVHNIRDAIAAFGQGRAAIPDWAQRFDHAVAEALTRHDTGALLGLWPVTADGQKSHPTPEHFFPLIYAFGASDPDDRVEFPITGFELGSISMRSVLFR